MVLAVRRIGLRMAVVGALETSLRGARASYAAGCTPRMRSIRAWWIPSSSHCGSQVSAVAAVAARDALVSCVSPATGFATIRRLRREYWARHARGASSVCGRHRAGERNGHAVLVEVGPGNALSHIGVAGYARRAAYRSLPRCRIPTREINDRDCLLDALGHVWSQGAAPDWVAVHERTATAYTFAHLPLRAPPPLDRPARPRRRLERQFSPRRPTRLKATDLTIRTSVR